MAAKVSLAVAPTFQATVEIPAPGGSKLTIGFVFRHRTKAQLEAWSRSLGEGAKSDAQIILDIAEGWTNVEEEFGEASLALLCENFHAAGGVISTRYMEELMQARLGN